MSKKKDVVININPFGMGIRTHSAGFVLTFRSSMKKRDGSDDYLRRKIVHVHFEYWWLKVIIRELWKAIQFKRDELNELENGMKEK